MRPHRACSFIAWYQASSWAKLTTPFHGRFSDEERSSPVFWKALPVQNAAYLLTYDQCLVVFAPDPVQKLNAALYRFQKSPMPRPSL